jgi:hypothetical protein
MVLVRSPGVRRAARDDRWLLVSHAKPHDERAGHRTTPTVLGDAGALVAPEIPDQLRKMPDELKARWLAFWTSPVAVVLDPVTDLEPVTRLFRLYALQRKMFGALEQHIETLEQGWEGYEFDPGWARNALSFSSEIRQLEQTLGVTPRGRLVIGAAVAAAGRGQQAPEVHDDADD